MQEQQRTVEDSLDDRAERIVEAEERLRERDTSDDPSHVHVDLHPGRLRTDGIHHATVTDIEFNPSDRRTDKIRLEARPPDGDTISFTLDAPESLDGTPLHALLDANDVSASRIGDLDTVPIARTADGDWYLVAPPSNDSVTVHLDVGDAEITSITIPSPGSLRDRCAHWAECRFLNLPSTSIYDRDQRGIVADVDNAVMAIFTLLVLVFPPPLLALITHSLGHGLIAGSLIGLPISIAILDMLMKDSTRFIPGD